MKFVYDSNWHVNDEPMDDHIPAVCTEEADQSADSATVYSDLAIEGFYTIQSGKKTQTSALMLFPHKA